MNSELFTFDFYRFRFSSNFLPSITFNRVNRSYELLGIQKNKKLHEIARCSIV